MVLHYLEELDLHGRILKLIIKKTGGVGMN